MWCASDNHNNMCHICAKELLDSNFNQAVFNKISIFNESAPISHTHKNHKFLSIIIIFLTHFFFTINVMAVTSKESTFFNFLLVVSR